MMLNSMWMCVPIQRFLLVRNHSPRSKVLTSLSPELQKLSGVQVPLETFNLPRHRMTICLASGLYWPLLVQEFLFEPHASFLVESPFDKLLCVGLSSFWHLQSSNSSIPVYDYGEL